MGSHWKKTSFATAMLCCVVLLGACGNSATTTTSIEILSQPVSADSLPDTLALSGDLCTITNEYLDGALTNDQSVDTEAMDRQFEAALPLGLQTAISDAMQAPDIPSMAEGLQEVDNYTQAECGVPFYRTLFHVAQGCADPTGSPDSAQCFDPRLHSFDDVLSLEDGLVQMSQNVTVTFQDVSGDTTTTGGSDTTGYVDDGNFQETKDPETSADGGFKLNLDG